MSAQPEIVEQKAPADVNDINGKQRYRKWSVFAKSRMDARLKLYASIGLELFTPYIDPRGVMEDPNVLLQKLTVDPRVEAPTADPDGIGEYIVDAEYSTYQGEKQPQIGGPWVWSVRPTLSTGPVDLDSEGNPIITSSWEAVDPPITALRPEEVLHGEKYFQGTDEIAVYLPFRPYNGTANATTFFGAPKGCVLAHVFQPTPSSSGWIKISVDFQYKPPFTYNGQTYEGWQDVFQDKGTRRVVDSSATRAKDRFEDITIPDADGRKRRIDHPVPLDGSGGELSPDDNPVYIVVMNYKYKDFNSLPGS